MLFLRTGLNRLCAHGVKMIIIADTVTSVSYISTIVPIVLLADSSRNVHEQYIFEFFFFIRDVCVLLSNSIDLYVAGGSPDSSRVSIMF